MKDNFGTINTEKAQSIVIGNRYCMSFESFKKAGCRKWVHVSLKDLEETCGLQSSAYFQQNGESGTLSFDEMA